MISWVNPDQSLAKKDWKNYLLEGPIAAIDTISKLTNTPGIHLAGYCIGGTLLACTLAYMQNRDNHPIISATYFNTLLDFTNPGELKYFLHKEQLETLISIINKEGYLDGKLLDLAFNLLRPYNLIGKSFINKYLLEETKNSDLLFWNADPTNLPKKMAAYYLKNIFFKNILKNNNGITLNKHKINLKSITTPSFVVASKKDHIVPWESSYESMHLCPADKTFILAESGHVTGIINPPAANKYSFTSNRCIYASSKEWLETANESSGSWWPYWKKWLTNKCNKQISYRQRKIVKNTIIEKAPGTFVQKRI